MTTEIQNHQGRVQRNSQERTSAVIDHLNACLLLVRPAWMTDKAAAEWLTIAATDVAHLDIPTIALAAKEARTKCTHHGQIVPAILASSAVADQRQFDALKRGLRGNPSPPRLGNQSEVQRLITSTARDLKA